MNVGKATDLIAYFGHPEKWQGEIVIDARSKHWWRKGDNLGLGKTPEEAKKELPDEVEFFSSRNMDSMAIVNCEGERFMLLLLNEKRVTPP